MHKVEKFVLPQKYTPGISRFVENTIYSPGQKLLCENAIPTTYCNITEYPAIVFGENARYIQKNELKNGAILDVVAAEILAQRGIDTGLIKCSSANFTGEMFCAENDEITNISEVTMYKIKCSDTALVKSVFMPGREVASYLYENEDGLRFYIFAIDAYRSDKNAYNYFNNYYRQQHLIDAIPWLCKKSLPAICVKNPFLYMQTAQSDDKNALSVALFNVNFDEIIEPEIILDQTYSEVKFLNCMGKLYGKKVKLFSNIEPYGFAAFEVK